MFMTNKFFLSVIIFVLVFTIFILPVDQIWFSVDDLGNIISGIVKDSGDLFRIFTEDERNYIYPINFNVPIPNFISIL